MTLKSNDTNYVEGLMGGMRIQELQQTKRTFSLRFPHMKIIHRPHPKPPLTIHRAIITPQPVISLGTIIKPRQILILSRLPFQHRQPRLAGH
jgi:hypothetical protein